MKQLREYLRFNDRWCAIFFWLNIVCAVWNFAIFFMNYSPLALIGVGNAIIATVLWRVDRRLR